jgi:hypothetical protein
MKYTRLMFGALALSAIFTVTAQNNVVPTGAVAEKFAQIAGGPGIVVSGSVDRSQLPANADKFLNSAFPGVAVSTLTKNFVKDTYNVTLANNVKLVFDKDGKVDNIVMPNLEAIPANVLSDILPAKAVKHIAQAGYANQVFEIKKAQDRGFSVFLLNNTPPQMIFDLDGTFLILDQ